MHISGTVPLKPANPKTNFDIDVASM